MKKVDATQATPRWLYRFLTWMQRTPLNGVLVVVGIFLLGAALAHWAQWQTGRLPTYELETQLLFQATWLPGNLLFWILMDRAAYNAITNFAAAVNRTKHETQSIYTDFISINRTTAPGLLIGGLILGVLDVLTREPNLLGLDTLIILLSSAGSIVGGVIEIFSVFRLLRQLVKVDKLYKSVQKINLFNLWPIYALSRYGYTLAMLFILATVLIDLLLTRAGGQGIGFLYIVYTFMISLIVFLAPLFGINNRLRNEKAQEMQRLGIQLDSVYNETEAAVSARKLSKVSALRNAAGAIKDHMEAVQNVATWPWNPGSLRNLFLPILLPLALAILQRYVLSFLGL